MLPIFLFSLSLRLMNPTDTKTVYQLTVPTALNSVHAIPQLSRLAQQADMRLYFYTLPLFASLIAAISIIA